MLKEFKEFAFKGNVMDMAVGIIIGAAFGTVVSSLVNDVIMPPIGLLLGGVDFSQLHYVVQNGTPAGPYATIEAATAAGAVTINWGAFLNNVLSFLIVAWAVFLVIKSFNAVKRAEPPKPAAAPEPSVEERLLGEIRDLLKVRA